eukprot:1389398-Amorphochlora_amoeboformis.AAC.1
MRAGLGVLGLNLGGLRGTIVGVSISRMGALRAPVEVHMICKRSWVSHEQKRTFAGHSKWNNIRSATTIYRLHTTQPISHTLFILPQHIQCTSNTYSNPYMYMYAHAWLQVEHIHTSDRHPCLMDAPFRTEDPNTLTFQRTSMEA